VRAFGEIARKRDDVHLLIAGPDDEGYGKLVRQWLAHENVLGKTTFAGMLSGSAKDSALHGADLFVLPSYSENFAIAVVEAMAAGLPVVISNRVNIWREVAETGAGLATNCDSGEVAEAISAFLDCKELWESSSSAGRKLVGRRFTWCTVGQQMLEIYQEIVSSRLTEYGADTRSVN